MQIPAMMLQTFLTLYGAQLRSRPPTQDSGHDTSYTSSMNAVNISSTSHPDLSSLPNTDFDSDTDVSQFFNMI